MFKTDLHTHSTASPDGGITTAQYRKILDSAVMDCIAVTDHNTIELAQQLQQEYGNRVIVGEEIMTSAGEIIGLFLSSAVDPGQTLSETVAAIRSQGGVVYVPHPFETVRKGLHPAALDEIAQDIDLIEVCNGRALFQDRSSQAVVWAKLNRIPGAASSDAHGVAGLGRTYMQLSEIPTADNLVELCGTGILRSGRPGIRALLYPKYHRFRRKVRSRA